MADNEEIGHYNDQNQVSITKCRTGVKIGLAFLFFYLDAPKLAAYPKIVPAPQAMQKLRYPIKASLKQVSIITLVAYGSWLSCRRGCFFRTRRKFGRVPPKNKKAQTAVTEILRQPFVFDMGDLYNGNN